MSSTAEITLRFADGERLFRLTIGAWRKVQERCDAGPMELLQRYVTGAWRVDDVRMPIREGLIAAGMTVAEADALMRTNFDDLPIGQFVTTAQLIVSASIVGSGDDEPKKPKAGAKKTRSRAASSGSPTSTASPPRP